MGFLFSHFSFFAHAKMEIVQVGANVSMILMCVCVCVCVCGSLFCHGDARTHTLCGREKWKPLAAHHPHARARARPKFCAFAYKINVGNS